MTAAGSRTTLYVPSCTMVIPHTRIHCVVPPGVGVAYQWMIKVGGAWSHLSRNTTSYAPPVVTRVEPATVLTNGRQVQILGSGFGSKVPCAWA